MKIALAQLNYHIGNFKYNTEKSIAYLEQAKQAGADLVVFPELSICGYQPQDFLDYSDFIESCEVALAEIAEHCDSIACIVGLPLRNSQISGKDFYNCACFIENKVVKHTVRKTLLPTYDVFDEYRYFEPNTVFSCIEFKGVRIALTICEDLWNINDNPLYTICPMDELIKQEPDLMINIAASPFSYSHDEERIQVLGDNARKYKLPLFYVNNVGAQTEIIFDGGSLVFDEDGAIKAEMRYFEEDMQIFDTDEIIHVANKYPAAPRSSDIEQIYDAIILGIRDYFRKSGFSKAILGLSGGIDSAVVCALACEALGKDQVLAVLMPSKLSSVHSIEDAENLVRNLSCKQEIISIADVATAFETALGPAFKGMESDITEENIQARSRGTLLMAMANKFGYVLLNTSNKSEVAVGYGTLYGDMCGAIGVIGDVYKTQVFQLARYINRNGEIIPEHTIIKPPSAELRPNQKDSDSLPDYTILDGILHQYIEGKRDRKSIIAQGFSPELVSRVLKMVSVAEFKRHQTAPILRVSPKGFGVGRRMPIVAKYQ